MRDPEAVVRPILDALAATKSWLTNGELVTVPDHATRIKAFETVADRLLGKPTQSTEITGADGGPLLALLTGRGESRDAVLVAISLDDPETREAIEGLRFENYVQHLKIDDRRTNELVPLVLNPVQLKLRAIIDAKLAAGEPGADHHPEDAAHGDQDADSGDVRASARSRRSASRRGRARTSTSRRARCTA